MKKYNKMTKTLYLKICNIMKLKRYRIVTDTYRGYEVQCWRLWFPFWIQGHTNTHSTIEDAKDYINKSKASVVYKE